MTPAEIAMLANTVITLVDNLVARDGESNVSPEHLKARTIARKAAVDAARAEGSKPEAKS